MANEDEIFEYIPPSAAAPEDAAPPPSTEGLDTAPLVSSEEAFRAAAAGLTRDAAGRALHGGRANFKRGCSKALRCGARPTS